MKHKYIIYMVSLNLIVGCSEKLDLYPSTQQTEGTFYQNETELRQSVDEIYRQLGLIYNAYGVPDLFGELYSDNTRIISRGGGNNFGEQIVEFNIQADNGFIKSAWENNYSAIYICNNAIFQLENTSVDIQTVQKNSMIAQIMVVRALIYFNMVRAFGPIPYVDTKINQEEAYTYLRVAPEEIYQNLVQDLEFAKQNLPESYTGNEIGRVTRYAAAAILAKIYMTQQNMALAKNELEFVINSKKYSLDSNEDGVVNLDDYLFLFQPDTKNSKSSILEIQYFSGNNAPNADHQASYTPFTYEFHLPGQSSTFRGQGSNTPTIELEEEFEANDPRKETSTFPGFENLTSGAFIIYPYTMKFFDPDFENEGQNFEIIRYADILLMYSEVSEDPQYLNMVRDRVSLPPYGSADYPTDKYSTLALAIEHERRIELCFEFHRFFDLVRTNRAIDVLQPKGYNINESKLVFPIPLNEIDINPEITQNPGY